MAREGVGTHHSEVQRLHGVPSQRVRLHLRRGVKWARQARTAQRMCLTAMMSLRMGVVPRTSNRQMPRSEPVEASRHGCGPVRDGEAARRRRRWAIGQANRTSAGLNFTEVTESAPQLNVCTGSDLERPHQHGTQGISVATAAARSPVVVPQLHRCPARRKLCLLPVMINAAAPHPATSRYAPQPDRAGRCGHAASQAKRVRDHTRT